MPARRCRCHGSTMSMLCVFTWFPGQEMGDALVDVLRWRRRAAGKVAGVIPSKPRGHTGIRTPPRPQRRCQLPRGSTDRIPVVRHRRPRTAVPIRFRSRLRRRGDHGRPSRRRCITTELDRGRSAPTTATGTASVSCRCMQADPIRRATRRRPRTTTRRFRQGRCAGPWHRNA